MAGPFMMNMATWFRAPQWAVQLDFVGPRVRTSIWGWLLLLAGLSVLVVQVEDLLAVQTDQAQAQDTLHRLARAQHQLKLAQQAREASARKTAGQEARLSADGYQHAAQLAQWLGFDWAGVWSLVETQTSLDKVVVTGFSLDLNTLGSREGALPDLQLHALVTDDAAALQWAAHMGLGAQLKARDTLPAPVITGHGSYTHKVDLVMPLEAHP